MPYVGRQNVTGEFIKLDPITTSATNTFNLLRNGAAFSPATAEQCIVSVNGVTQAPQDAFNISGSQIVFTSTLSANDVIDYILVMGNALSAGVPSDGSVSTAKLANNSVDLTSKVTGILPTANGGNGFSTRPAFAVRGFGSIQNAATVNGFTVATGTDIIYNYDEVSINRNSAFNNSTGIYTVPVAGLYQVQAGYGYKSSTNYLSIHLFLTANDDTQNGHLSAWGNNDGNHTGKHFAHIIEANVGQQFALGMSDTYSTPATHSFYLWFSAYMIG